MFKKMSLHFEEKMKLKEDNLDERMRERDNCIHKCYCKIYGADLIKLKAW